MVAMVSTDVVFHLPRCAGAGSLTCRLHGAAASRVAVPTCSVVFISSAPSLPLMLPLPRTTRASLTCSGKREEAAEAHARFRSREGDHLTLLSVFRAYNDVSK